MCTAMKIGGMFGRTLDLEYTYGERVVICPRDFPLAGRHTPTLTHHHALIGMATVADGYPLYYDAVNEHGLAMAALHFHHSGAYATAKEGAVTSFELIPYVLGQCGNIESARRLLEGLCLCSTPFSPAYPVTRLHWMVADATASIVVESTAEGVRVYDNPIGVMTNEPPFPDQLDHWQAFTHLTAAEPATTPPHLGRGSGSQGLPGDFTSPSRLVRAAFVAAHSAADGYEVAAFFQAMGVVAVPRGCVRLADGGQVVSQYTCGMDLQHGVYYCHTHLGRRLTAVRLADPDGDALVTFPLPTCDSVAWHN